jgi:hypothetical protein
MKIVAIFIGITLNGVMAILLWQLPGRWILVGIPIIFIWSIYIVPILIGSIFNIIGRVFKIR